MKKVACSSLCLVLYFCLLLLPAVALSGAPVDPHGKEGMCHYCHRFKVVEEGKAEFRLNTVEATCLECHGKRGATLEDYLKRMLPDIKIKKKLIVYFTKHPDFSCHSCHNVMCLRSTRKELQYRNPHIQLDKEGRIIEKACLFCHAMLPDYKHPSRENVAMRYDISYLCSLCHAMASEKVGLGLGKTMTQAMIQKKKQFEREYDVSLPLGPNDTVVCASCHNPHQSGVILGKGRGATTGEHRLVLEDIWLMCTACHLGKY